MAEGDVLDEKPQELNGSVAFRCECKVSRCTLYVTTLSMFETNERLDGRKIAIRCSFASFGCHNNVSYTAVCSMTAM